MSFGIVFDAPPFSDRSGLDYRDKPVLVQAFIQKSAIEGLDIGVFNGLARADESQGDALGTPPGVQYLAFELGAVVHRN